MFWPVIAATTLAFFAMVGFEDSVNMAEECKDPTRHFPKVLLAGLFITGAIYVLVSISAITLVPPAQLGETQRSVLQQRDDQQRPLVGHPVQDLTDLAVLAGVPLVGVAPLAGATAHGAFRVRR